jgi:sec-independent protein translocase protein TatC
MADDLFEDSTMTFGEHIEELRKHMIRALAGILLAFIVMVFFGNYVVKLIVEPVEDQLMTWSKQHLERRAHQFKESVDDAPNGERRTVPLRATLDAATLREIAASVGGDAASIPDSSTVTIQLEASLGKLVEDITMPLAEVNRRWSLRSYSAQEAFVIYFKAVLGASVVFASPWVFYQLYSFVAVGLYSHEKRFVNMTLPFSIMLFLAGVAICYFLVFPAMLRFFLAANEWMDIEPEIRLSEWVGFAVILMIIFGVTFQMPLLMLMLERVGIVTHDQLAGKRKMAVFVNFIVAAMITPGGDPNTMLFLAAPMCILYELGLFLMRYFQRSNPFEVTDPEPVLD